MEPKRTNGGGLGFLGLLTIVLVALKLMGYVAWSWLWVLSPIWLPVAILMLAPLVVVVAMLAGALVLSFLMDE